MAATDAVAAAGSNTLPVLLAAVTVTNCLVASRCTMHPLAFAAASFTSLALTRVLPWRRFSKGSTLVIEVRPAAERVTSAQSAASASKDSTALPLVQFASLGLLRHYQIFT